MLIMVDFSSETPIYLQIYEQVVMAISKGSLRPGEGLPSVRRLSEDIGVNIHTVNKAYAILRDEGYLKMSRRRGAFVTTDMPDSSAIIPVLADRLRQLAAQASVHGIGRREFMKMAGSAYLEAISKKIGK